AVPAADAEADLRPGLDNDPAQVLRAGLLLRDAAELRRGVHGDFCAGQCIGVQGLRAGDWGLVNGQLGTGTGNLEPGTWNLEPGTWRLLPLPPLKKGGMGDLLFGLCRDN